MDVFFIIWYFAFDNVLECMVRLLSQAFATLIQKRASGELQTLAAWMREYISVHPDYKYDSYVSDRIVYDMLKTVSI